MKSEARLDSVVFHLTPTRTRCDLVIISNGKTEKIASGLLNPFLAHLKTAQDQIAKGGYSITLEPASGSDSTWFTKGTVERFVRFVSTPEVLERVNTIESEILQIHEAIAVQSSETLGLSTVEDHQTRSTGSSEGSKPVFDADSEKAIVLYKPGAVQPEPNGPVTQEENSKVQLLRVLETRKTVLQKEQGMAFARAVAAGFDMDHLALLILFAECFGASRLKEACIRFMELWKQKHETGQWVEIEAAEALSAPSDFSSMNASGIMLSSDPTRQRELHEVWSMSNGQSESNGKPSAAIDNGSENNGDKQRPLDSQVPYGYNEHFQGQFQPPMYSQWPIHPPPGGPVFQPYPMPGMPYYQGYPASGPFFQPGYASMEDPRFNPAQKVRRRRHSVESKESIVQSDDESVSESETSLQGQETRRKGGRSGKKKPGVVVIRNVNYIASKRHNNSGDGSQSASETENSEEAESMKSDVQEKKSKNFAKSSKNVGGQTKSNDAWNLNDGDEMAYEQGTRNANWEAFQNCLLRGGEETVDHADKDFFSSEKEIYFKRRQSLTGTDPLLSHERDLEEMPDKKMLEFDANSGKRLLRRPNDDLRFSREGFHSRDSQLDVHFTEMEGGGGSYKRMSNDDFVIVGRGNQSSDFKSFSDPVAGNEYGQTANRDTSHSHGVADESFIVPFRSISPDQAGTDGRIAIDMDSELPSMLQRNEDSSNKISGQLYYEPDDLTLMPERGSERETIGYDPAVDYESEVLAKDANVRASGDGEDIKGSTQDGSKKLDKEKKSNLDKRKLSSTTRNGKPSRLNPLSEAQLRAERLRSYKADLQKIKKEKEEEEIKRLEALKRERQKRIAARGTSSPAPSPSSSGLGRTRLPTKISPNSNQSKFSDSEPGSSSRMLKLPMRTSGIGSSESLKTSRATRSSSGSLAGNGLSRSVSSLSELKTENSNITPDLKGIAARTRRLSEPKVGNNHPVSSPKPPKGEFGSKSKLTDEPEIKKITAIVNLDKTKSASLPELKIRSTRASAGAVHSKPVTKETTKKGTGTRSALVSESSEPGKNSDRGPDQSQGDDNPVIEKTVVMLEQEKYSVPGVKVSEHGMSLKGESLDIDSDEGKAEALLQYDAIRAPPSPIIVQADQVPSKFSLDARSDSNEVANVVLKSSTIDTTKAESYRPPYARASSLEDPCTSIGEYDKPAPVSFDFNNSKSIRAHVPDFSDSTLPEHTFEALEKPRGKESSKGFRKLLKFGRKNHGPSGGERNDADGFSVESSSTTDDNISHEVPTLKNLISQDESPVASATQKAARSFSLLSPFRSKTAEKKLTT